MVSSCETLPLNRFIHLGTWLQFMLLVAVDACEFAGLDDSVVAGGGAVFIRGEGAARNG